MEIRGLFKSSIKLLSQYQQERLPVRHWGWVVIFILLAAYCAGPVPRFPDIGLKIILVVGLVFQFRLWDDLSDLSEDRVNHPERILCRAESLRPYQLYLALLFSLNFIGTLLIMEVVCPLLVFLSLNVGFFVWYRFRNFYSMAPLVRSHMVLIKYPVFLILVNFGGFAENKFSFLVLMVLVLICFSIFEILHDSEFRIEKEMKRILFVELSLLSLTLLFLGGQIFPVEKLLSWIIWAMAFLNVILFAVNLKKGIMKPVIMGYGNFLVSSVALFAFSLGYQS